MDISRRDVADLIETFVRQEFRIGAGIPFSLDEHLFEAGIVDSAGAVELITFIESTFNVQLDDEHVFSEQFTTVNGMAEIVMACRRSNDASPPIR